MFEKRDAGDLEFTKARLLGNTNLRYVSLVTVAICRIKNIQAAPHSPRNDVGPRNKRARFGNL